MAEVSNSTVWLILFPGEDKKRSGMRDASLCLRLSIATVQHAYRAVGENIKAMLLASSCSHLPFPPWTCNL